MQKRFNRDKIKIKTFRIWIQMHMYKWTIKMKLKGIFKKEIKRRVQNPISQWIQRIKPLMEINKVLKKLIKIQTRISMKMKEALAIFFPKVQILLLQMGQMKVKTILINSLIKSRIKIEETCPTPTKIKT